MKKNKNLEEQLISRMMDHMEINKASDEFTQKVMDRVYLETIPARQSEKPLISNTVWIIIGIVISALLIYLFSRINSDSGIPTGEKPLFTFTLPEFGSYTGAIVTWFEKSQQTLIWYGIGLVSVFILLVLERLIRNLRIDRNFLI